MENQRTPASAYTAGPWFYQPCNDENTAFRIQGESDYPHVANVFFRNTNEEQEANARLISAAPALRVASQHLYNAINDYLRVPDRDLPRDLVEAMNEVEAAWRKADGIKQTVTPPGTTVFTPVEWSTGRRLDLLIERGGLQNGPDWERTVRDLRTGNLYRAWSKPCGGGCVCDAWAEEIGSPTTGGLKTDSPLRP